MVWDLPPPWDIILLIIVFAVVGVGVFHLYFSAYHRRYFSGKAMQLAAVKTVGLLVLWGGSFWIVFWLVSQVLPPGWLRYLVGGGVWWLLSQTVVMLGWKLLDRVLDNHFG